MPKVSIIIPTYNSSKFIDRAIKSILRQTVKDWELLVVDDCSTDNTEEIIRNFIKNDNRIKFFKTSKNSGGPALPKNIGVRESHGQYVAFLDHDDEWLPEKLEKQLKVFENSKDKNLGLVSCGANLINNKGKCFGIYNPIGVKAKFPEILIRNPIYSNSSVLIKKEIIDATGERDTNMKYSEDWDMWIRICENGYTIYFINKSLFNYYFHGSNITKSSNDTLIKQKDALYVFNKHLDLYKKYDYVHVGYFRLGVMYFLGKETKKSREFFHKSSRTKKMFVPSIIGYLLSFFGNVGVSIVNTLIFFYRIFHGKVYLIKSTEL